jgi:hypothetical protein
MIEQKVILTTEAHERLRRAQKLAGLGRFDTALGAFLDGVFIEVKLSDEQIAAIMLGYQASFAKLRGLDDDN